MQDMPRHTRLTKRRNSTNWQFRIKIPTDLQDHYGKQEARYSLKTSNYREACKMESVESLKWEQEFETVRRQLKALSQQLTSPALTEISDLEVDRIAQLYTHFLLEEDEQGRRFELIENSEDMDMRVAIRSEIQEDTAQALEDSREALTLLDTSWVESEMEWLLPDNGIKLKAGSEAHAKVAEALLKAAVRAYELIAQRDQGKVVDTPPCPIFTPQQIPSGSGLTLTNMLEKWNEERQGPQTSYIEFQIQVRRFVELHGDLDVDKIGVSHIREFKDAMLKFPRISNSKALRDKTVPQLLEYAQKHPDIPLLSPNTARKALAAVSAILGFALNNGYIDSNPAHGIKIAKAKVQEKPKVSYTIDDLNTIFSSPIYTENVRPKGGSGEAAKWIPLLALFTGARLEELGQLHTDDLKEENGILYLDMQTIDEDRKFKTQSSLRRVPLHQTLIDLGFPEYVQQQARDGRVHMFHLLKPWKEKRTHNWSKWWNPYTRKHGTVSAKTSFHSFRHTVKDAFRDAEVREEWADRIQGHATSTEGRKYGSRGPKLEVLNKAIQQLQYPGLDLSHLQR